MKFVKHDQVASLEAMKTRGETEQLAETHTRISKTAHRAMSGYTDLTIRTPSLGTIIHQERLLLQGWRPAETLNVHSREQNPTQDQTSPPAQPWHVQAWPT